MLTTQRKQHLLEVLTRDGQIVAKAMSRELALSEDTIRRDLRELAQEGLLVRVHGGALPIAPAVGTLEQRRSISPFEKSQLGKAAAAMVRDGQVIGIDGGTTTLQLAKHLPHSLRATVVTHSPAIALELSDHRSIDVILIGGKIFKHSMVAVGSATVDAVRKIRTDLFFLGATGIHPSHGVTTGDLADAEAKAAFCDSTAEIALLASPEKLNVASPYKITDAEKVSTLVVASDTPQNIVEIYSKIGISVVRG